MAKLPAGIVLIHVTHVITGLEQGGAEAMLEKLLLAARAESPQIINDVISLGGIGTVGTRLLDAGIRVRALCLRPGTAALIGIPKLARWLRDAGPDTVVQTWMYHADLIGGIAARLAGCRKLVWNLRQSGLAPRDLSFQTRLIIRACAKASKWLPLRIVANSRRSIMPHCVLGYESSRLVVIPNGFNTRQFSRQPDAGAALRRQWGIGDAEIAIGMVARVDPLKDHANFIATAERVAKQVPNARFVLVGRDVPESPTIAQAIAHVGLDRRFVLDRQRDDIPAVMSALDIFCLSSRTEGFPNVLGEAMACETPCVTTDCGDACDLLGDDRFVAPVENPEALATCVVRMARLSLTVRRELGCQQRWRIEDRFDITRVWRQYLDLYIQL